MAPVEPKVVITGGGIAGLCAAIYARQRGKAALEGWLLTPETGAKQLPCTVRGIRNFYMVGQWISPGRGLPSGLITARSVVKRLRVEH